MFYISSGFNPMRVVTGQKEPVILEIKIKNRSDESKLASLVVKAPFSLGFDRVGLFRETRRRIGYIKGGMEKIVPIQIFPKPNIQEGEYKINIKVMSHADRYDKLEDMYEHSTTLRVISR